METRKLLTIGSVSHGTMRNEDLIPDFLWELDRVDTARANGIREDYADILDAMNDDDFDVFTDDMQDAASDLVNTLFDALNEYCPDDCYFGAHPGDGSDYGCWPIV